MGDNVEVVKYTSMMIGTQSRNSWRVIQLGATSSSKVDVLSPLYSPSSSAFKRFSYLTSSCSSNLNAALTASLAEP
jgi:hypothetical protein